MLLLKVSVLALACIAAVSASSNEGIQLAFGDNPWEFDVVVNGQSWLSSKDVRFYESGAWKGAADGSLKAAKVSSSSGTDNLGPYNMTTISWTADTFTADTNIRMYPSNAGFVVYEQVWTSGAESTNSGDKDGVSSAFPCFEMKEASIPLGVAGFHGTFIDDSTRGTAMGQWPSGGVVGGLAGGPMVLYSGDGTKDVVVLSSISEFMSASFAVTKDNFLAGGVFASAKSVPAQFKQGFVTYHSQDGINNAMTQWGDNLLKLYGKTRDGPKNDNTLQTLGYNTDHGAYYYYNTNGYDNYYDTLTAVHEYADKEKIPYHWILLDSWWYFKGNGGGVSNWTARPDIFPPGGVDGLKKLNTATNWPVIGHNRYWSSDTVYAKQNGGEYEFSDVKAASMVVPLEQRFWDFLMESSKEWGLAVYEQDWLYNELEGVPLLTENVTMARTWLTQMGLAAQKNNLTVQYCMPYPRHVLQSLEIASVTQVRASDDYVPSTRSQPVQWRMGTSSMLAHSLALAPFKDNFWTNVSEHGSSCGDAEDNEIWRESVVATLSTGPVTPSDGVGFSTRELIMRSCTEAGYILKPSRPATAIDAYYSSSAKMSSALSGRVWSTYTSVGGMRWDHIFATEITTPYKIERSALTLDRPMGWPASVDLVAYALETKTLNISTLQLQQFTTDLPITVQTSVDSNAFELWHVAPVIGNVALLGELSKWVPVAEYRFPNPPVTSPSGGIQITAVGTPGETISVSFATIDGDKISLSAPVCTFKGTTLTVTSSGTCA